MNALLIGCGSKFGLKIMKVLLNRDWKVNSISGSDLNFKHENLNQLAIDWKSFNVTDIEKFLKALPSLDIVFFNQNGSSLSQGDFQRKFDTLDLWKLESDWSTSYTNSCILPFHIIKTLGDRCNSTTRVAWMLSSMIYNHSDLMCGYADYYGNKYQNYVMMKNFSHNHEACFFGINPGSIEAHVDKTPEDLMQRILLWETESLDGTVRNMDFTENKRFEIFNDQS